MFTVDAKQQCNNKNNSARVSYNLDYSRAMSYCACSRCGWGLFGHFYSHLSFLSSFSLSLGDSPIWTEILSQRAVNPKTTNQLEIIIYGLVRKVCGEALTFLFDNIYIRFGSKLYRQIVDIPIGTNFATLVVDLPLTNCRYSYWY